jgi:translation initiation factor 4E
MAVESAATAPTEEFVEAGGMIVEEGGGEADTDIGDAATNEENRHPLQDSWSLWYLNCDKTKNWDDRLIKLMTFDTVEDFWACYHHVQLPSKLPVGSDYMLFKNGIQPKWEDPQNCEGGKWAMETDRKHRTHLDSTWLETLLAVIGEGFGEAGQLITGAVVQVRRKVDRLQIWTSSFDNADLTMSLGRQYKSFLKFEENRMVLQYQCHKDSISKQGSTTRARFRV